MQRDYSEWETIDVPELRQVTETSAQPFNPLSRQRQLALLSPPCCC